MNKAAVFLFLLFAVNLVHGQSLNVASGGANSNPANLMQNVYRGGINLYNVSYSGNNNLQMGYYSNGTAAIGTSKGVLLSTGNVQSAATHNTATNTSTNVGNSGGTDPDLLSLSGGQPIFDWVIVEFDVIPNGNALYLQYLLASEEYNEYVCSSDADVFGILVSGPGIAGAYANGADLVSLDPATSTPAGINSINNGIPGTFGTPGGCSNASASVFYHDNTDTLFEFDGYTDLMTGTIGVECENVYHVKIVLADVGNNGFDTGIFLPEQGIFSNGVGTFNWPPVMNDSIIAEGCRSYDINIYNSTGFSAGQTIQLTISGTATNGVDYQAINPNITFPAGDSLFVLQIIPLADGITEGLETVIIDFDVINPCGDTVHYSFTVYIRDENPLVVTGLPGDQSICAGDPVTLNIAVSGGFPGYAIFWNGVLTNNISYAPTADVTYAAAVYDQAGCEWYGSFHVTVNPLPVVNAGPDIDVCKNTNVTLGVNIDGGPGATYIWSPSLQLNANNVPYPVMTPSTNQTYTVTVTSAAGCTASDDLSINVLPVPYANAGADQTIVYQQTTTTLLGSGVGGVPFWTPNYYLSCDNCFQPNAGPDVTTTYTLTVYGPNGCQSSDDVTVIVDVPTDVFVPGAFSPNGDGHNDVLFLRCYTAYQVNFRVYDKWGQTVFQTNDPNKGWDGTVNGAPAAIGLYVYSADIIFVNNAGSVSVAGEVNLVR